MWKTTGPFCPQGKHFTCLSRFACNVIYNHRFTWYDMETRLLEPLLPVMHVKVLWVLRTLSPHSSVQEILLIRRKPNSFRMGDSCETWNRLASLTKTMWSKKEGQSKSWIFLKKRGGEPPIMRLSSAAVTMLLPNKHSIPLHFRPINFARGYKPFATKVS